MNPDTIRNQRFLLVRRGYDPDAVVAFLDEVADALESARATAGDPSAAALELADADRLVDEARTRAATQRLRAQRDIEALQRTARARRARLVAEIEELAVARDQLAQDLDRAAEVVDRVVAWVRRTDPAAPVDSTATPIASDTDEPGDLAATPDRAEQVATESPSADPAPEVDHEPRAADEVDASADDDADAVTADDDADAVTADDDADAVAAHDEAATTADPAGADTDAQGATSTDGPLEPDESDDDRPESADEVDGADGVPEADAADGVDDDGGDAEDPDDVAAPTADVIEQPSDEALDAGAEDAGAEPAVGDVRAALRAVQDDVLGRLRDTPRGDVDDWMPSATVLLALDDAATPAAGRAFLDGWHEAAADVGDAGDDADPVGRGADTAGDAAARDALEEVRGTGRMPDLGLAEDLRIAIRASLERGVDAGDAGPLLVERVAEVHRDVRQTMLPSALGHVLGAAHHHGLVARWGHDEVPAIAWVLGEEQRCPGRRCRANASDGVIAPGATFAFGEVVPPAHTGCTCTLRAATPDELAPGEPAAG